MSQDLFIRFNLFNSEAFKRLSMGQFRIYFRLSSKIKYFKARVRKKQKYYEDNPDIIYPMRKIAKDEDVHLSTVQKAISKLVELGFIDIVHRGSAYEGDYNVYNLSDRWRLYGTPSFVNSKVADCRVRGWRAFHAKKKEADNPPAIRDRNLEQKQTITKLMVIRKRSQAVMPDSIQAVSKKAYSQQIPVR
jgi:hypothetical protein